MRAQFFALASAGVLLPVALYSLEPAPERPPRPATPWRTAGDGPGAPARSGARLADPGARAQSGQFSPAAGSDFALSQGEYSAAALFRRLERDGDGRLTGDELPAALRESLDRWDTNRDGAIDAAEFRAYFLAWAREASPGAAFEGWDGPGPRPADVPGWFAALDTDRDGRVGLDEWRAAGGSAEECRRINRSGDGFITRHEAAAFAARTDPAGLRGHTATASASGRDGALGGPAAHSVTSQGSSARSDPWAARGGGMLTPTQLESRSPAAARVPAPRATRAAAAAAPATPTANAAPATAAASRSIDELATTPLPLAGYDYWDLRNEQNLAQLDFGPTNVLFLGDSITDMLSNGVGRPVWDAAFAPLGAYNFAVGGATTSEVLWQIQTGQVAKADPKAVVLLIGTNNLGQGQSPSATAAGISLIVDQLRGQLPDTRILLLGLLPRGESPADPFRAQIAEVNRRIAALDGGRVAYLDLGGRYLRADGTIPPRLMPDFLHPSLPGYVRYADSMHGPLAGALAPE
jgi:lysophospholipase L1-like esterase